MTVGQSIQKYRKELGLSQEELGQKLLVSRQTVSLWEKDQTVPTIDNLIRLKEVFGISADEILGFEEKEKTKEEAPKEVYKFQFSQTQLQEVCRLQTKSLWKDLVVRLLIAAGVLGLFMFVSKFYGFFWGMFVALLLIHYENFQQQKKMWKTSIPRMSQSIYQYEIFEHYLMSIVWLGEEKVFEQRCYFTNIKRVQILGEYLVFEYQGRISIMLKNQLQENLSLCLQAKQHSLKTKKKIRDFVFSNLSIILFVVSLLSLPLALRLTAFLSDKNNLMVENMWVYFLCTPIPIASIIFGVILKSKGYKYLKNIIIGAIMLVLLCLYGLFPLIFSNVYSHTDEPIKKIEQMLSIDIPQHKQINTQDWTQGSQTGGRGHLYSTSDIYFEEQEAKALRQQIKSEDRWLSSLPSELVGITSTFSEYSQFDYMLIYNVDTKEYNRLPVTNGKYHFVSIHYWADDAKMKIAEYTIDYIKGE